MKTIFHLIASFLCFSVLVNRLKNDLLKNISSVDLATSCHVKGSKTVATSMHEESQTRQEVISNLFFFELFKTLLAF